MNRKKGLSNNLGLRGEKHLDKMGFHPHVITPYNVMKTPPWTLIVPTVCFDVCKYMNSYTHLLVYRLYYSELLEYFKNYTHMDLRMAIKQLWLLSVHRLSSQNVYLTRRQFLLLT